MENDTYFVICAMTKGAFYVFEGIEKNPESHIINAAKQAKHIPANISDEMLSELYEKYKYEFSIKLAGFWKATIIWCEETPRKNPEEMATLITELFS